MDFDQLGCPECDETGWDAGDSDMATCPACGEQFAVVTCELCDVRAPKERTQPHYGAYGGYRCDNC
jgi:hypothetical protein